MPDVSPIMGSLSSSDYIGGTGAARVPVQTLGQQDFLKLLVTKMTAQDPMSPQSDTEFIAQMAQFSSLEQSKDMDAQMASLRAQQEVLTANNLIGRSVTLNDGKTDIASGIVQSVSMKTGSPTVNVGGKDYDLGEVVTISPPPQTTAIA